MYLRRSWKAAVGVALLVGLVGSEARGGEVSEAASPGYEALSKCDWGRAVARFNEQILATPGDSDGYRGRGLAYGMMGKSDLAIADLTMAIRLDPTWAMAYASRGGVYLFASDYDRAIADCDEAIRRGLKDPATYNNRGYAHFSKGNAERAVTDFTEAIRLNPTFAIAFANRGLARCAEHAYGDALLDLDDSIRISKSAGALQSRGRAYYHLGNWHAALADLDDAVRLAPKRADSYRWRAIVYLSSGNSGRAMADFGAAIDLDPRDPNSYLGRANCLAQRGDYGGAVADVDRAIAIDPKSPGSYELRGALRICDGDVERGAADLETAIRLNSADPARWPESRRSVAIACADLRRGTEQVQRMLADRPAMRQYGENAGVLYLWAARKFAGEDAHLPVFWRAGGMPSFATGQTSPSSDRKSATIRVAEKYSDGPRKGQGLPFEELWRAAVFELYNAASVGEFGRLEDDAAAGRLTKAGYAKAVVECESRAAERTRAFYIRQYLPWARKLGVPTNPRLWFVGVRSDLHDCLLFSFFPEGTSYWRAYERQHDWIIARHLAEQGEYQRALNLVTALSRQPGAEEEQAMIGKWIGYCLVGLGKPGLAADAYDRAVRLDSRDAEAICDRGFARSCSGALDMAIADFTEAIRLDPGYSQAYYRRGLAYQKTGDIAKAREDLARARSLGFSGRGDDPGGSEKSWGRAGVE